MDYAYSGTDLASGEFFIKKRSKTYLAKAFKGIRTSITTKYSYPEKLAPKS